MQKGIVVHESTGYLARNDEAFVEESDLSIEAAHDKVPLGVPSSISLTPKIHNSWLDEDVAFWSGDSLTEGGIPFVVSEYLYTSAALTYALNSRRLDISDTIIVHRVDQENGVGTVLQDMIGYAEDTGTWNEMGSLSFNAFLQGSNFESIPLRWVVGTNHRNENGAFLFVGDADGNARFYPLFTTGSSPRVILQEDLSDNTDYPFMAMRSDPSGNSYIDISAANAKKKSLRLQTANSLRWEIGATNTSESSTATGSNFHIDSYTNTGTYRATPVAINRDTSLVTLHSLAVSNLEAWQTPTLLNSWVDYAGFVPARYYKNPIGEVIVEGTVSSGTGPNNVIVFVLPAGYRPSHNIYFATVSSGGACRMEVQSNGSVIIRAGGSATWTSLTGIRFRAA